MMNKEAIFSYIKQVNWPRMAQFGFFLLVISLLWYGFNVAQQRLRDEQNAPIRTLVVLGQPEHVDEQAIIAAIQRGPVGSFFDVDVQAIQQRVEALPWIKQASIRKQWPDKLQVYVTEHVAVASWNEELLLDPTGTVFSVPVEQIRAQQLPALYGPEGSEQEAFVMFNGLNKLLAIHQLHLQGLMLSERYAWQLWLSNDVHLQLGQKETIERVDRYLKMQKTLQEMREDAVESVDLRYDTGLAVRWKEQQKTTEKS